MPNFDLVELALKGVCPNNDILYDDLGMPSFMVYIPKMTYAQLGLGSSTAIFPAFIVNGSEVDAIYISKYQNIVQDGRAFRFVVHAIPIAVISAEAGGGIGVATIAQIIHLQGVTPREHPTPPLCP